MREFIFAILSACFLLGDAAAAENLQEQDEAKSLRCSISLTPTAPRVGDPFSIHVKLQNVSRDPTYVYFPMVYPAELLEIKNEKGETVEKHQTAVYGPLSLEDIRKCFHLLEPNETFATSIHGRIAFDFVAAPPPLSQNADRSIHIGFQDIAHRILQPGKYTVSFRLSFDPAVIALAKHHGFSLPPIQHVVSNSVGFIVRLMTRLELNAFIADLRIGEVKQKSEAIEVLQANADRQAVGELLEIVIEGPSTLAPPALDALGHIQDPSIIPDLMTLYRKAGQGDLQQRILSTVRALTSDPEQIARLLVAALQSGESIEAKSYAAYELGSLRRTEGIPAMLQAANSGTPRIQRATIDALGVFLEADGDDDALVEEKSRITVALIRIMKNDPDRTVRSRAASALGKSRDAFVVPALLAALEDPNLWVGSYAAHSLGKVGGLEAISPLENYARRAQTPSQVDAAQRAIAAIRQRIDEADLSQPQD